MRVCVTGHRGYIGSVLVPMLRRRGHAVLGIDSGLFDECVVPGAGVTEAAGSECRRDVRDLVAADLVGQDGVVHLAGLSNDPLGELDPELTRAINARAAVALAAAARTAAVPRFVFASTCSVYGDAGEEAVDEDAPLRPLTAYAMAKAEAEAGIRDLADDRFSPVVLRFATAFGYSPMLRFDLVANNLVAHAAAHGRVLLKSQGRQWRALVHVVDIARSIVHVLEAPRDRVHGAILNVGSDAANLRIGDLADEVARMMPGARVERAADAAPDRRSYRVSFARLRQCLPAFAVEWPVARGIAELRDAIGALGLQAADFEGARFNRLLHLRRLLDRDLVGRDLRPAPSTGPT